MEERLVLDVGRRKITIGGAFTLGRGEGADVRFANDTSMSRTHARVWAAEGKYFVEDLGSTNGTFVNGQQVTTASRLRRGDLLRIGEQEMRVGVALEGWASCDDIQPSSEPTTRAEATRPARVFELISRLTHDALSASDPVQAERLATAHLRRLLDDARTRVADQADIETAARLALSLARALPAAYWVEYVLDLYDATPQPMNGVLLRELERSAAGLEGAGRLGLEPRLSRHRATPGISADHGDGG